MRRPRWSYLLPAVWRELLEHKAANAELARALVEERVRARELGLIVDRYRRRMLGSLPVGAVLEATPKAGAGGTPALPGG